jgi:hypothetical protein
LNRIFPINIVVNNQTTEHLLVSDCVEDTPTSCAPTVITSYYYIDNRSDLAVNTVQVTVAGRECNITTPCPSVNYATNKVLTPENSIFKPVFDNSPKYNGELSGSLLTVFREKTKIQKKSRTPVYGVNLQFLNLPKPGMTIQPTISIYPFNILLTSQGGHGEVEVTSNVGWEISN